MPYRLILLLNLFLVPLFLISQNQEEIDFHKRGKLIIDHTADHYNPPSFSIGDPQKYCWPKAMARFEKYGLQDSLGNHYIDALAGRAPFHFTLVGMARIMMEYADAPSMKAYRMRVLEEVFGRSDKHNAWTSEGTENHINMARCSGYLYAQEAAKEGNRFPKAAQRLGEMEAWIMDWSKKVYLYGAGEWNSGIYTAYDVISWLNVYDFAEKENVRLAARAVLDYYAAEMALNYSFGVYGGSQMRGGALMDKDKNATTYLCWLWFGKGSDAPAQAFVNSQYIQAMHAVTSGYRPPKALFPLARKELDAPEMYYCTRPSYLFEDHDFVMQSMYVSPSFTLGSASHAYGGWTGSTVQLVNDLLVLKSPDGMNPILLGGNGRHYDRWDAKGRDPWTQHVQHKNVLFQLTRTPKNAREITDEVFGQVKQWQMAWQRDFEIRYPHREGEELHPNPINFVGAEGEAFAILENQSYFRVAPALNQKVLANHYLAELDQVYLLVSYLGKAAAEMPKKVQFATRGKNASNRFLVDEAAVGKLCGFVLEVCEKSEYLDFAAFEATILSRPRLDKAKYTKGKITYTSLAGDVISVQHMGKGTFMEATVDWGFGATEQMSMLTAPPFQQPDWPKGKGNGRIAKWSLNGEKPNFWQNIPVFSGKQINMQGAVLEIGEGYKVDYRDEVPRFLLEE